MPPRKKAYREEDVKEAVAKVKAKEISLRAASKLYSIPVMTLSDHVNGKVSVDLPVCCICKM